MQKNLERSVIQFALSPAYMEDDLRQQTNKLGFCRKHMDAMYKEQNRLGLALMLHTHIQEICKNVGNITANRRPLPFLGKDPNAVLPKLQEYLGKTHASCYVCKRVDDTFNRYIDTFFHLWSKGGDDAKLIESQDGYCLPCFVTIITAAEKSLGRGKRDKFMDFFLPQWQKFATELAGDLDWFIQKFDHRFANEPWKNSKDALPRAMNFLAGREEDSTKHARERASNGGAEDE